MAYTHWRIRFFTTSPSYIYEFDFLDSIGTNLYETLGGTLESYDSQHLPGTYSLAWVVDNNNTTHVGFTVTGLFGIVFPSAVDVTDVTINMSTAGAVVNKDFVFLERSNDGVTWEITMLLHTAGTWAANNVATLSVVEAFTPKVTMTSAIGTGMWEPVEFNSTFNFGAPSVTSYSLGNNNLDTYSGGLLQIHGYTRIRNTPVNTPTSKRCILYEQKTGLPIQDTLSDPDTGYFAFKYIRDGLYYVIAFDPLNQYNGEILTNLTPTEM